MSATLQLIDNNTLHYNGKKLRREMVEEFLNFLNEVEKELTGSDGCQLLIRLPDFDELLSALILVNVLMYAGNCILISKRKDSAEKLLRSLSTLFTDYHSIFVKTGRVKIYKNFMNNVLKKENTETIVFFGYPSSDEHIEKIQRSNFKRKIIVLTGLDSIEMGKDASILVSNLQKDGWKLKQLHPHNIIEKQVNLHIIRLQTGEFRKLFKLLGSHHSEQNKRLLKQAMYFYFGVPVPLKIYSSYIKRTHVHTKYLIDLPSNELRMLASVKNDPELEFLAERLSKFEESIWSKNPKFEAIMQVIDGAYRRNNRTPLIFPNRTFLEAFKLAVEMDRRIVSDAAKTILPLYGKSMDITKQKFRAVLLTCIPSPELLLKISLITNELILPVYVFEIKYLEKLVKLVSQPDYYLNNYGIGIVLRIQKKDIFSYRTSDDISEPEMGVDYDVQSFDEFVSISRLFEETDDVAEVRSDVSIDTSNYVIRTDRGNEIVLKGYEKILKKIGRTIFIENSLEWCYPGELSTGDTILYIDREVMKDLLKKELEKLIAGSITEMDHSLQLLIGLVSLWKKRLYEVSSMYSKAHAYRMLKENGLSKHYVTVNHWFHGLSKDPVESVISSLLNPEINIGPQSKEDVIIFARTFGFADLQKNADQIFNAMKLFRSFNRKVGRILRRKIISMIMSGELEGRYEVYRIEEIVRVSGDE